MSQVKKRNLVVLLIMVLISFFVVGCKKDTPVNDISFVLQDNKQVVLLVGESLNMSERIEISPSYATNKKYSLISSNNDIVKIQGSSIVAVGEGSTQVRVVSDDDSQKEDFMSVVVRRTKTKLSAPTGFDYNPQTQSFSFDIVPYATSYTLKLNGETIDLGNSKTFKLRSEDLNKVLIAEVMANAPDYTQAFISSDYAKPTSGDKIYQVGKVKNVKIESGSLTFECDAGLKSKISLNNEEIYNSTEKEYNLTELDPQKFDDVKLVLKIETCVANEVTGVVYHNSLVELPNIKVVGSPALKLNQSAVSWDYVPFATGYNVKIGSLINENVTANFLDLSMVDDLVPNCEYNVSVEPVILNTLNVVKTAHNNENNIKIKRLAAVENLKTNENHIVWDSVDKAQTYSVVLTKDSQEVFNASVTENKFDMSSYTHGVYEIYVKAVAKAEEQDGVYYVPSEIKNLVFDKKAKLDININDYKLGITNLDGDTYSVQCDNGSVIPELDRQTNVALEITGDDFTYNTGVNTLTVVRLWDENSVNSDPSTVSFNQLESEISASISDSKFEIDNLENYVGAYVYVYIDEIPEPEKTLNVDSESVVSLDLVEKGLSAGDHSISVKISGNGTSTFGVDKKVVIEQFTVLEAPTLQVFDIGDLVDAGEDGEIGTADDVVNETPKLIINSGASKFKLVKDSQEEIVETKENDLSMEEGETCAFKVQAVGDGSQTLSSSFSAEISVYKIKASTLKYNSNGSYLNKTDNDSGNIAIGNSYIITKNGEAFEYDLLSPARIELTEDTTFTMFTIAKADEGENYYLNSNVFELQLTKIANTAVVVINNDNNLEITPNGNGHDSEKKLELIIKPDGDNKYTFLTDGANLTNGTITLPYSYSEGKYTINLMDENNKSIIQTLVDNTFNINVKFINNSTGEDIWIDSEYMLTDEEFEGSEYEFSNIEAGATYELDSNNQRQLIISAPTSHYREFGLKVTIGGTEFLSNGENGLVYDDITIPYSYADHKYIIDLLDEQYNTYIDNLADKFKVNVEYVRNKDATIDSDCNSGLAGESDEFDTLDAVSLTREDQKLKITNLEGFATYDYSNYGLIINNSGNLIKFDGADVESETGYFTFDINFIYNNGGIDGENTVQVVTINASNTNLAIKGEEIIVERAPQVTISSSKDNDGTNNSVIISFEAYGEDEQKYLNDDSLYVMIASDGSADQELRKTAAGTSGQVEFNLDDINLTGDSIMVKVMIRTGLKAGNVEIFNSSYSNELTFERIAPVNTLSIQDGDLTFVNGADATDVVGYELYKYVDDKYVKLHDGLLRGSTTFDLHKYYGSGTEQNKINLGKTQLFVRAISAENKTNSNLSEEIVVYRYENPEISIVDGKFEIDFPLSMFDILLSIEELTPVIKNGDNNVQLTIKDTVDGSIKFAGLSLICEPYLFLRYSEAMVQETLTFQLKFNGLEKSDGSYCLDSVEETIKVYGLHSPTDVKKGREVAGGMELITWTNSSANPQVVKGHVIRINHTVDGAEKIYYTSDSKLKYLQGTSYVSYDEMKGDISSARFPAGYDSNDDGVLDVKFNKGIFKVSVQEVPKANSDGKILCSSDFSDEYVFTILEKPVLDVQEGKVIWSAVSDASQYKVNVYTKDGVETIYSLEDLTTNSFDFTKIDIDTTGMLRVEVQSINNTNNIIDSEFSEPIYVYKLAQAQDVKIEDGVLSFEANTYFTKAIIEFICGGETKTETYYNSNADNLISGLPSGNAWKDMQTDINNSTAWHLHKFSEELNIDSGKNYSINITLIGNSNKDKGIVSSKVKNALGALTVQKLNHELKCKVDERGIAQLSSNLPFDAADVYMNYMFDEGPQSSSEFWKKTIIYKIDINGTLIYAVDYYSVITSQYLESGDLVLGQDDTHGYVIYNGTTKTIYFNVYRENKIDFNQDDLKYYPITQVENAGSITLTGETEFETIKFIAGETSEETVNSFEIKVSLMGGDSYEIDDNGNKFSYLNSNKVDPGESFIRYAERTLSVEGGKLKFASGKNTDSTDNPIYLITVYKAEGVLTKYYLYYNSDENEEGVELNIKEKFGASINLVEINGQASDDYVYFDISEKIDSGFYNISIQTYAGSQASKFLLDSVESAAQPFHKWTDVEADISSGVITFDQSYYQVDSETYYCYNYEIAINYEGTDYVYSIGRVSNGVRVDEAQHKVYYTLPNELSATKVDDGVEHTLTFEPGENISLNIRANSPLESILRGTYNETNLPTKKASTVEEVKVENGVLTWKGSPKIGIKITSVTDDYKFKDFVADGVVDGDKFTYEFSDMLYATIDPLGNQHIEAGKSYNISVYICGDDTTLNGNIVTINHDVERLTTVNGIKVNDNGISLEWSPVSGAAKYQVDIDSFIKETTSNSISLAEWESLTVGEHTVEIKAIGSDKLNSMMSDTVTITKLASVQNISLNNQTFGWDAVENATGYYVELLDSSSNARVEGSTVTTCGYTIQTSELTGTYKLQVTALGGGTFINSDATTYNINTALPIPVSVVTYESDSYRFKIELGYELPDTDEIYISYTLQAYDESGSYPSNGIIEEKLVTEKADDNIYYYPITVLGVYSEVSVVVKRNINDSDIVSSYKTELTGDETTIDFNLFKYGAGITEKPYYISSTDHLFNIEKFPSAHYVLANDIDLSAETLSNRISDGKLAIITTEFGGTLDGKDKAIYGFGGEYENLSSFALFEKITGTIEDLNIGISTQENTVETITNVITEPKTTVKMALLANSAEEGAVIDNVKIQATSINITGSSVTDLYIAGLVNELINSTISNLTVNGLTIDNKVQNNTAYVGGAVSNMTSSTSSITGSTITVSISSTQFLNYVGGVVGRAEGSEESQRSSIEIRTATITMTNINSTNMGGIVGFARYVNLNNCKVIGTIKHESLSSPTNIGGIIGTAQSVLISNSSVANTTFDITISNLNNVFIGAIVGSISNLKTSDQSLIDNCYWDKYEGKTQTSFTTDDQNKIILVLGACGSIGSGVTVNVSATKTEQE